MVTSLINKQMARYKIQPISLWTQNEAPYMIAELDESRNVEAQAIEVNYLCKRFPHVWLPSITKLPPIKPKRKRR